MYLVQYSGDHSVIFGEHHSWKDWHLIPSAPPVIPPPKPKVNYLEIPGTNGSLDISEILTGVPTYDNRTGSMGFIYLTEFGSSRRMYETILNSVHGKRLKVILTDDPEYYYEGRVSVKEYSISAQYSGFSFDYTFDPFKLRVHESPGYSNLAVDGERVIYLNTGGSPMLVTPVVTVNAVNGLTGVLARPGKQDVTIHFPSGVSSARYPGLTIGEGGGVLTVTGTGTISLEIRGGSL